MGGGGGGGGRRCTIYNIRISASGYAALLPRGMHDPQAYREESSRLGVESLRFGGVGFRV